MSEPSTRVDDAPKDDAPAAEAVTQPAADKSAEAPKAEAEPAAAADESAAPAATEAKPATEETPAAEEEPTAEAEQEPATAAAADESADQDQDQDQDQDEDQDEDEWMDLDPDDPLATPAGAGVAAPTMVHKPTPRPGPVGVIMQFVIFPLAIVLACTMIYFFFKWTFSSRRSYDELLRTVARGWQSERWQAAYELQFRINDRADPLRKTADVAATIAVYEEAKSFDDPRVRANLAIVLGHLGDKRAEDVLIAGLKDEDPNGRLNAVWALGRLESHRAVPALLALLSSEERIGDDERASFYKVIAYVLGEIRDFRAVDALVKLLEHPIDDVRWNAALALARFKDPRALPTLRAMLDRRYLDRQANMRPEYKDAVLLNALRAIRLLQAKELKEPIEALGEDRSFKIRQAAREVLDSFEQEAEDG